MLTCFDVFPLSVRNRSKSATCSANGRRVCSAKRLGRINQPFPPIHGPRFEHPLASRSTASRSGQRVVFFRRLPLWSKY